ncbi:MAG TPA: FAD-dependent oxidoreductase, partial [Burkholderiales bacterium]
MSNTPLMSELIWLNRVAEIGISEGLNYHAAEDALRSRRRFVQGLAAMTAAAATPGWAAAVMQSAPRIAIVGGGLAGLSCAYELRKRKIDATVYEASERLGGRCAT